MVEPEIQVGLLSSHEISFILNGIYHVVTPKGNPVPTQKIVEGEQQVCWDNGMVLWKGNHFKELLFIPTDAPEKNLFELHNVMIGKHFHWQQHENQSFQGALRFIVEGENITAINRISTERYLTSVIASEMSATASLELLKAHAVISRSWLLAQLTSQQFNDNQPCGSVTDDEIVRWYNRSAHQHYDVCADDHCQRYQGLSKVTSPNAQIAVEQTRGEILIYNGEICDTRFSKCCGGQTELFSTCWEDKNYPYLTSVADPFCGMADQNIVNQVMVNYDQQTTDFYRWTVTYTQQELHDLILANTGIDLGDIIDLEPLARGTSGRIYRLKIVGSLRSLIIGKELEIRKTLSKSHLFSSAFTVEKQGQGDVPQQFVLHGSGWGHGVGLCQIGAAVMGEQGYKYKEILLHYYKGAKVERMY
ncbi:MAG: SpoIID/LytB domain-containing protein [Bacteroidaceae bacterium]|nr:SpoIID/LytB domain-containing protein [Bacteroidaceae bacterium]